MESAKEQKRQPKSRKKVTLAAFAVTERKNGGAQYTCCGQLFRTAFELEAHLKSEHSEDYKYEYRLYFEWMRRKERMKKKKKEIARRKAELRRKPEKVERVNGEVFICPACRLGHSDGWRFIYKDKTERCFCCACKNRMFPKMSSPVVRHLIYTPMGGQPKK